MPKTKSKPKQVIPSTLASASPQPRPKPRPSKAGKWRALVLIGVHVLMALHIAHWLSTGSTVTPVEPSEAIAFSQNSVINAGLIFFAAMILLTAVFGRFFCGWGCHLVALQDLCRHWMLKIGIRPRPFKSRALAWVPTLAFLYMFIWPLLYRLWIGDSLATRAVELTTPHFWATFPGLVVGVLTFLVCGFACVYFLGAKGFCTYACPYGAAFAAADKVAPMRIRVTDACEQCGHCTAVCSSNIRVHEEVRDWGMVVSPGCMKCQDCVSVCPKGALYYGAGPIPLMAKRRTDPSTKPPKRPAWGDELLLVLVFAGSFLIVRGLYGLIPFLMSLGAAAVIAFLALTTLRLFRESTVGQSGLRLKSAGKLLPLGRHYLASMAVLAVFMAHSAVVRSLDFMGNSAYERTAVVRQARLADPGADEDLPEWAITQASSGIGYLQAVEGWGLFDTFGNSARLAWMHALVGSGDKSVGYAQSAIARDELAPEMYQLLALNRAANGDSEEAIAHWRSAMELRPDLPEPYLGLGLYQARRGDLIAAQEVFDQGAAQIGNSAELFYNAGLARALLGRSEQSLPLFERALAINPQYREARENLAGVYASLGNFTRSVEHYSAAVEQAPDDADTRVLLARALLGLGNRDAAIEELRTASQLAPENRDIQQFLQQFTGDR